MKMVSESFCNQEVKFQGASLTTSVDCLFSLLWQEPLVFYATVLQPLCKRCKQSQTKMAFMIILSSNFIEAGQITFSPKWESALSSFLAFQTHHYQDSKD